MNRRPRILVVDDDHDTLDILEILLYKKYEIVTAGNGFEALAAVRDHVPSLVITDVMMPGMDGIRLLSGLRGIPATAKVPVVAVTAFTEKYPVKSLISLGFAGVIAKPPDTAAVEALVSRLLAPGQNA
ncbi:MAG: response regulator [Chitinispirillaceae bacterium]|nr:response regulator [Chitinispirillaceae bacterium]